MSPRSWQQAVAAVRGRWTELERDWQSVAAGFAVVAVVVLLDVRIPW